MKIKETYTLEELCSGLTIPLVKFCQMAGITEATLIRLRKGYAGRQHTLNSILAAFTKVYGIDFTLENVEGLTLQDKPHQKAEKPSVSAPVVKAMPDIEKTPKRAYKARETGLPDGCILALDFARNHDVKRETFRDHMTQGLGSGQIPGPNVDDSVVPVRDYVKHETRPKPGREKETERYLDQEQQTAALEFWKRHSVDYSECNDIACWCHTLKQENEE